MSEKLVRRVSFRIAAPTGIRPRTAPLYFSFIAMIDISVLYPLLFGVVILALVSKRKRPALPYPPGPKGYPIWGNILDLTTSLPLWEDITSLANRYGMLRGRSIHDGSEAALSKARISYTRDSWARIWSS